MGNQNEDLERFKRLEKAGKVNLRKHVVEPPYIIRIDGIGAIPRRDIFAIKAKSKQGKSQAATVLMAGVLGDESLGITVSDPYKTKVIYVDTEQTEANTIIVGHRVHRLLGWPEESNNARFRVYNMRDWDWQDKLPFIEYIIKTYKPTMVVIDGIADLLINFNDVEKSSICILNLMQIASKSGCSIGNVLHENKAKDDNSMKGHLGTMLLQKASDVFEVTKKDNVFTLKQTESRNKPIGDIQWIMDDNGNIVRKDKDNQQIKAETKEANTAIWRQIYAKLNVGIASYNQLNKTYSEIQRCSIPTANRHIKLAISNGILSKTTDGQYKLN